MGNSLKNKLLEFLVFTILFIALAHSSSAYAPYDNGNEAEFTFSTNYTLYDNSQEAEFLFGETVISTCLYVTNNWRVNCSEYCNLSTNVNLQRYNITFSGEGMITVRANITNFTTAKAGNGCYVNVTPGGKLG